MATQATQTGESRSESSEMTGASSNASPEGTQQQRRQQLVHREAANVVTKNMTKHADSKIVRMTGSSTTKKQCAIGCEYFHIMIYSHQLME